MQAADGETCLVGGGPYFKYGYNVVKGVDLVVLDQGIDTSTPVGKMFFHILGAIAEFEHALMSERTRDGLAAARARGRTGGWAWVGLR